jgi:hypothetical protein
MAGGVTWGRWAVAIDVALLVALSAVARLWGLSTPNSVVFDEYHFGKFSNWYAGGSQALARERVRDGRGGRWC